MEQEAITELANLIADRANMWGMGWLIVGVLIGNLTAWYYK